MGIVKALSGKKMSVNYMKVADIGSDQVTQIYKDKEFELKDLQKMVDDL